MQDITFQLNVIAVSVCFIAIALLLLLLVIFFLLLASYFRFSNRLDRLFRNLEAISEKTESIASFIDDEARRTKRSLDQFYDAVDSVTGSVSGIGKWFNGFTYNFSISNIVNSIVSLFTNRKNNYKDDSYKYKDEDDFDL